MSLNASFAPVVQFDWDAMPNSQNGKRWTAGLKKMAVDGLNSGLITMQDLQDRYQDLSIEEIECWVAREQNFGQSGLRVTRTQSLRLPTNDKA